jgi:hypothetical protein
VLPTTETTIFISLFAVAHLVVLLLKTLRSSIDLYDLLLLSSLSLIPAAFVTFPELVNQVSAFIGVGLPLVLMFACLFVAVFVMLHRLISQVQRLRTESSLLAQELGLLRHELDEPASPDVAGASIR